MATEVLEQQFSVGEQASLTLSNLRGSVWIGPLEENQPQNQAFVKAVKDTSSGDAKRTRVEMRQEPGGRVVVETKFNEAGGWLPAVLGLNQPCKVDYQVRLPQSCSLHVTCVSSSAEVRGLTGSFQIKSISGPLTLQDLSGQIGAKTISGRLEAENLQGSLELECISGAISLGKSQAESLRAATTSGDVFLQTPVLAGPYQIKTVSGDVEFVIPAESGLDIKFSSISGRVDSTQKLSAQRFQGGSQSYQLNGGGTRLDVHTTSGDLRLRTLGEPPRAAPEPKPGPGYSEEVLDRIERGEISVDEALQAIENGGQIESAAPSSGPEPEPLVDNGSGQILERVERGEITVDEALRAIENGGLAEAAIPLEETQEETAEETPEQILERVERGEISVEQALEALKRQ